MLCCCLPYLLLSMTTSVSAHHSPILGAEPYSHLGNGRCANSDSHGTMAYRASNSEVSPAACAAFCTGLGTACSAYSLECSSSCSAEPTSTATCLVHTSQDMQANGFYATLFHSENTDFSAPTGVDSYNRGHCYKKTSTTDSGSPHIITFASAFETAAQHTMTVPPLSGAARSGYEIASISSNRGTATDLVNGATYTVRLEYQDVVSNIAVSVEHSSVVVGEAQAVWAVPCLVGWHGRYGWYEQCNGCLCVYRLYPCVFVCMCMFG